ncbi:MAG TPA: SRPBCC family protein [Anaeromyxobacter sp.]
MPKFQHTLELAASPERAWEVVGDLAGVTRWIPGCTRAEVDGAGRRVCTFADGHVQHERILGRSDASRSYRYEIESGVPMRNARGRFAVLPRGEGSAVVWESEFDADPGSEAQLREMWERATGMVLDALRRAVEAPSR